jgi:hypothetical protein
MQTRRWVNQSQPQTLQIAVFLLYFNAAFALLAFLTDPLDEITLMLTDVRGLVRLLLTAALVGAGYLIANERKIGYPLGIAAAAFPILIRLWAARRYHIDIIDIGLLFDAALVALLLHPHSREYQRIWFK